MEDLVKTRTDGPIYLIGINRPQKKNCVNHETARRLIAAFEHFNTQESLKIAILYGEGGTFCAGYDLEEVSKQEFQKIDPEFLEKYRFMGPSIMRIEKPLIAAIEGYAVAGGLELALMADLRVCSQSATMGVFCRRVGVPLIDGGTVRLPRIIGMGRALDMILTGRGVPSSEALNIGLVNRVCSDGEAVNEACRLARLIASHPEKCMLADRASVHFAANNPDETQNFENEFKKGTRVLGDSIKGAQAFVGKKPTSKI